MTPVDFGKLFIAPRMVTKAINRYKLKAIVYKSKLKHKNIQLIHKKDRKKKIQKNAGNKQKARRCRLKPQNINNHIKYGKSKYSN
jgi:hypothetical protein